MLKDPFRMNTDSGIIRNVKRGPKGKGLKVLSEVRRREVPERRGGGIWGGAL